MKEIRFHGRGGQGVVTSVEILGHAATFEGKHAQSFPSFGAERRGAPVVAFARVDDHPIRTREQIYQPDYVVVLDSTLWKSVDVTSGLKKDGQLLINTTESPYKVKKTLRTNNRVYTVDATTIAIDTLKRPISGAIMLGAFTRAFGLISMESLRKAVRHHLSGELAELNIMASKIAYRRVIGSDRDVSLG